MRIPKKFQVRGHTWAVKRKKDVRDRKGKRAQGLCDPNKRTLWINSTYSREDQWWTFVHEFLHLTMDQYEVGATTKKIGYRAEENIVVAIETELRANFVMRTRKAIL